MERIQYLLHRMRAAMRRIFRRRHAAFVYVAMGDSTVEGVGATHASNSYAHLIYLDLERHFKQVAYYNFGKRGARVEHVLANQVERAVQARPQLITISIGANDILHNTGLRTFRNQINALLGTLREQTAATIIMTNIPDFSFARRLPRPIKPVIHLRIWQYNGIIAKAAEAHDVAVVDTFRESKIIAERFPNALSDDNFHPSDFGYALWANTMLTIIYEHLRERNKPWWRRWSNA